MSKKIGTLLDRFEEAVRSEVAAQRGVDAAQEIQAEAQTELAAVREEMAQAGRVTTRAVTRAPTRRKKASKGPPRKKKRGRKKNSDGPSQAILDLLSKGETWTSPEIAEQLGIDRPAASAALSYLQKMKKIKRVGRGRYKSK